MKKIIRRGAAATLAAVTLITSAAVPVRAAAPRVQVDETMYVNLDYYGTATQINVVKGCTTNGLTEYTDYGTYDKVVNMTDDTAPEIGDGTVTWKLPEKNSRFYYQCTMPKNSVDLPWTFDVSYKLNGVEADASKLAGASGLVEVNVKATPNEKAKAYYKNNMVLTVLVPVDMEKCYSVDAPGAQVQSVGSYQAAMFAALPGEDGDFTVRVGTDNYENIGVIMMMVPGTLDELNRIKDLKEAKDTWREDGNKMYDSMNALLKTMESMKSDVSGVKGGLANLDQARGTVSANRKQIEALSTQALADLQAVTDQTTVMIPYLQTARDAVTDINSNTQALSNTMEDMQDELDRLYDRLGGLSKSLRSAADELNKGLLSQQSQEAIEKDLAQKTAETQKILEQIDQLLGEGTTSLTATEQGAESLNQSLDALDGTKLKRIRKTKTANAEETAADTSSSAAGTENGTEADITSGNSSEKEAAVSGTEETAEDKKDAGDSASKDSEDAQVNAFGTEASSEELTVGPSGEPGSGGVNDASWEDEIGNAEDDVEESLQSLSSTTYAAGVKSLVESTKGIFQKIEEMQKSAKEVVNRVNGAFQTAGDISGKTGSTLSALRSSTDELINLLDDMRVLIETTDKYVPTMLDSLSDSEELMNRLTKTLYTTHDMLSLLNDTLISAGDSLDAGTKATLQGMEKLLDKNLTMIDNISAIREAGDSMKSTLDEQLDKFEDENNFLNMDPEADKISFTSSKNPSPNSVQIVLRTDEISDDDDATDISDQESTSDSDEGPLKRMWNVLVAIVKAIIQIFQNR
jgi:DNA repair ATPase RecN